MWKTQAILTRVLQISFPKCFKTYQALGTELLKSEGGRLQKSIFLLRWPTTIISHNFSTQSDSAKALFELGKEKEAFASIKKELSLDPLDQDLHEILIKKLEEKNRLEDLEPFSREVGEMIADPKFVLKLYFKSAQVLVKHNMFSQALLAYREAMKKDPPMNYYLYYKYGEVLLHEGHYEEALAQFEQFKKGPKPNEDEGIFWHFLGHANNGAAYINYCLGRVQKAKEEFEKMIADGSWTPLTKWNYFLILCHLEDEKMIHHYKEHEFKGWFPLSDGIEWVRFYEQELKNTQKILERGDIDENTRKFNAKKLEALNTLLHFLGKRIGEEESIQKYSW